jgi:hypothetical protein
MRRIQYGKGIEILEWLVGSGGRIPIMLYV